MVAVTRFLLPLLLLLADCTNLLGDLSLRDARADCELVARRGNEVAVTCGGTWTEHCEGVVWETEDPRVACLPALMSATCMDLVAIFDWECNLFRMAL